MSEKTGVDAWGEAVRFLKRYRSFLVVSHVQPDGDAVSSTVAMAHILKQLDKAFVLTNESDIPPKYRFLKMADAIVSWDEAKSAPFEAVICVDCADRQRFGAVGDVLQRGLPLLNIDHHPTNDRYGDVNVVLSDRAATAEVIYELASYMELKWDRDFAEAVYTGMMTDTGCFRYANTTARVMKAAAHLLEYGVVPNEVAEPIYERMAVAQLLLLKEALNSLKVSDDGQIAWMRVTSEQMKNAGAGEEHVGGIVNFARNLEGVEVGILFKQMDNGVKASWRSRKRLDVSQVAKRLGGGGHARAAGCYLEGTLEEVERRVLEETRRALS